LGLAFRLSVRGWAKCPEGAFQLQASIRLIAEVTLRSTHYFGELLPSGPQAEASHICPTMNRNVPTKEGSEASFRFIVLRVCEVLKAIWAKRSEAANTLLTAVAVPGLICQEGKMRRFLSTATD